MIIEELLRIKVIVLFLVLSSTLSAQSIVELKKTDAINPLDFYGDDVAISGEWAIVSAPSAINKKEIGYIKIFKKDNNDPNKWVFLKKIDDPDLDDERSFGRSVDTDGEHIIVGAPLKIVGKPVAKTKKGRAYIFGKNQGGTNNWGLVIKKDPDLGCLIDEDSDEIYNFYGQHFGHSVAIDGSHAVVGMTATKTSHKSYFLVFEKDLLGNNKWERTQCQKTIAAQIKHIKIFKNVIAVNTHYATLSTSIPYEAADGSVEIYMESEPGIHLWYLHHNIQYFGEEDIAYVINDMDLHNNKLIIGVQKQHYNRDTDKSSYTYGAIIYEYKNKSWNISYKNTIYSSSPKGYYYGRTVGIYDNYALIGSPSYSQVHFVYRYDGFWKEKNTYSGSDLSPFGQFGKTLAVDENYMVIGAPTNNGGSGYIFKLKKPLSPPLPKKSKGKSKIFPNPNVGLFNIKLQANYSAGINIYNEKGTLIVKDFIREGSSKKIELSTLTKGVYYVHLYYNDNTREIKRVIVR